MTAAAVDTVILAAGSSGRLRRHKALIPFGGKSAIRRLVETSLASKSKRTIVVVGAEAGSLLAEIAGLPVTEVVNRQFALGRTGSLKCALAELEADLESDLESHGIIVHPVDCPFVPVYVLDQLIDAFVAGRQFEQKSLWITPEYKGRSGHPVLLGGPILKCLSNLGDDFPLRDFLNKAKEESFLCRLTVSVESESILDNINTQEDLDKILEREGLK